MLRRDAEGVFADVVTVPLLDPFLEPGLKDLGDDDPRDCQQQRCAEDVEEDDGEAHEPVPAKGQLGADVIHRRGTRVRFVVREVQDERTKRAAASCAPAGPMEEIAERTDFRPHVEQHTLAHFRWSVTPRPHAAWLQLCRSDCRDASEVDQLRHAVHEDDVGRFQVTVEEPEAVQGGEGSRDRKEHSHDEPWREFFGKGLAILRHVVEVAVPASRTDELRTMFADVVTPRELHFAAEPRLSDVHVGAEVDLDRPDVLRRGDLMDHPDRTRPPLVDVFVNVQTVEFDADAEFRFHRLFDISKGFRPLDDADSDLVPDVCDGPVDLAPREAETSHGRADIPVVFFHDAPDRKFPDADVRVIRLNVVILVEEVVALDPRELKRPFLGLGLRHVAARAQPSVEAVESPFRRRAMRVVDVGEFGEAHVADDRAVGGVLASVGDVGIVRDLRRDALHDVLGFVLPLGTLQGDELDAGLAVLRIPFQPGLRGVVIFLSDVATIFRGCFE